MVIVRWLVIFESIAGNGAPLSREQKSVPAAIHGKTVETPEIISS